jgi:CSLREA domain-containing protein
MRITTSVPGHHRSRGDEGRVVARLPAIVVVLFIGVTGACHDDALRTNPMAPTPPALGVAGDGTWMVNSLADPGDGVCTNSECTLREAIAVAQSGEHITFKQNLIGTIRLTAGLLAISKDLIIEGPGADVIAVSGALADRVFRIGIGTNVTISGLTIRDGYAPGSTGGGIKVELPGRLTLIGSVVTSNTAQHGAGIYADGSLTLVGSTIARNVATGVGGGIYSATDLTVRRSTISDNTAIQGAGLEVFCDAICTTTLASSTITANDATDIAGGFFNHGTVVTVFNTIIAGNRAKGTLTDPKADCEDSGMASLGYNLSGTATGCELSIDDPSDVLVSALQVFTAVLEPVLANNGSPRLTHALIERGYAVDAGYCPGENGDERGFPRPYDDPRMANALDGCDIGAFEWQPADTKIKGPKP